MVRTSYQTVYTHFALSDTKSQLFETECVRDKMCPIRKTHFKPFVGIKPNFVIFFIIPLRLQFLKPQHRMIFFLRAIKYWGLMWKRAVICVEPHFVCTSANNFIPIQRRRSRNQLGHILARYRLIISISDVTCFRR